jgi:6-phosphogluconolactonase
MSQPEHVVLADAPALATDVAARTVAVLGAALEARDIAHLVVTGGSILDAVLAELADPARLDWSRVHVWWGDERFVDADSEDRNDQAVRVGFLEKIAFAPGKVHPVPSTSSGMSLDEAAAWYGQELDRAGGDRPFRTRGEAFFDVLLLGVGPDGHVASLFPRHPAQQLDGASAVAVVDSPKPPPLRVSLTWPVLNSSRHVGLLAAGEEKAEAVARAHEGIDPWEVPASSVRGLESTTWYLDESSATGLRKG